MKKVILVIIALLCVSGIFAEGAKYLIIAPDSFVQAVQPLADWKTKKGVKAKIVPLSITGNTASQIKNYILNAYNNWTIRPEYILLAGLGTVVPYSGSSDDYFVI
jgi:citrate lyase alpha subunit